MWNDFYRNLESKEIVLYILLESLTPESLYFAVSVKLLPLTYVHHCIYGDGQLERERYCTFEFRFVGHKISGKIVSETLEKKLCFYLCGMTEYMFIHKSNKQRIYEPRQANLVLIAYASSEGSGEQSRQNLRCSFVQAVSQEEPSDRKPDPWPPLNRWACAVNVCDDGMLEDTNSLDGAHI